VTSSKLKSVTGFGCFGEETAMEDAVFSKVAHVISAIKNANHVDQVITSLHSIATLLFPLNPNLLEGLRVFLTYYCFCFHNYTIGLKNNLIFYSIFCR
jgi:hypothetical protein